MQLGAELPVEDVAWLAADIAQHLSDPEKRDRLLRWVRETEHFPDLLAASAHTLVVNAR